MLGLKGAELGLTLAGPARVRSLNRKHRGVDRTTDVLSFPLYDSPKDFPRRGPVLLGDIVINPQLVERRAREYGVPFRDELRRLMVHGLLHLLGHDHEGSAYGRRKMERAERELLEGLGREG